MERKITIEEKEMYQENYQIRMLVSNDIDRLLPVTGRGGDGSSYYDYTVSGKVSMKAMYEKSNISGEDIRTFLKELLAVVRDVEKYLLNIHCLLLQPEYIYYEDGKYYFCYYPPGKNNFWEEFHRLTEFFVKQADYQDAECVQMIFLLHKETMEENYSLEKLIYQCIQEKQEAEEQKEEYDQTEHDWITEQEMGSIIMEETENLWTPVKRFLRRHKKPKWGDWDGLYIEEEEL